MHFLIKLINMKKFTLLIALLLFGFSQAQTNESEIEPSFVGEVVALQADGTHFLLEKQIPNYRSNHSVSAVAFGIGQQRNRIRVDNCCSTSQIKANQDFQLTVKAVDNLTDPMSIIQIIKLNSKRKFREAIMSKSNTFGTNKSTLEVLSFKAEKYGESSYLLTLDNIEEGEYGLIVRNPNQLDERVTVVSTFSIK